MLSNIVAQKPVRCNDITAVSDFNPFLGAETVNERIDPYQEIKIPSPIIFYNSHLWMLHYTIINLLKQTIHLALLGLSATLFARFI